MAIEPETYKISIVLDSDLYQDLDSLIEERGMSRAAALRFMLRLGFDHYKECRALGIVAVSDILLKAKDVWKDHKASQKV